MHPTQNTSTSRSTRTMRLRRGGGIAIAVILLISLIVAVGLTRGLIGIRLPSLRGPFAVGRINFDLIDPARQETFVISPQGKRAIVITVYYPARSSASAAPAPYTSGKMAELLAAKAHLPTFALQLVHSHAYAHVPIAAGTFPVVLFSPGIGTPPLEYTSTVEELASHGYIVALIYHTYSVPATIFADGHVATLNEAGIRSENEPAGASDEQTENDRDAIGSVWVADARFTLDRLTLMNASDALLKGHLDLGAVGMYGHSFGGATAAEVCRRDARFKACINMDGMTFRMTTRGQIRQPFLWMASDYSKVTDSMLHQISMTRSEFAAKIQQRNAQRTAFVSALPHGFMCLLKGSTHSTYITDEALFGTTVPGMQDPLATIDGGRAVDVIDAYVVAFFETFLKQQASPLMTGNASHYPEVEFTVVKRLSAT